MQRLDARSGGPECFNYPRWRDVNVPTRFAAPAARLHVCPPPLCFPGGEQPIPLWNEHDTSADPDKPKILLYSLSLMFKVRSGRVCPAAVAATQPSVSDESLVGFFLSRLPGDPDDGHHSVHASRALRDGPDRAGAV